MCNFAQLFYKLRFDGFLGFIELCYQDERSLWGNHFVLFCRTDLVELRVLIMGHPACMDRKKPAH